MSHDTAPPLESTRRLPRRLILGVFLAMVLAGLLLMSAAIYSAITSNEGLRLDVGTVDVATAPLTLELNATALVPGDVVATPLEITNDGSLELRYSITSITTTTDDPSLAELLELEIRVGVSRCDATGADADGTLVAGPVLLGGATGAPVLGAPATGQHPGDRVLGPGAFEVLCLRVELPSSVTEDEAAGMSLAVTLQIDAEQTAANP